MNSALPVEESYREAIDNKSEYILILLDAKAAFDTVIHSHMLRRAYLAGITDIYWTLIKDFQINAMSSIKWAGQT